VTVFSVGTAIAPAVGMTTQHLHQVAAAEERSPLDVPTILDKEQDDRDEEDDDDEDEEEEDDDSEATDESNPDVH
jgi:hypothetical protein